MVLKSNNWHKLYKPPNKDLWQGRVDENGQQERIHEKIKHVDIRELDHLPIGKKIFAFAGFSCDEGIERNQGRIGAQKGPQALRSALANLPLPVDQNLILYDAGDIFCKDKDLESAQEALGALVVSLLNKKAIPILFGGGHEIAWGHFQGLKTVFPSDTWGIVNFDAHLDTRSLLEGNKSTSGTSFTQIAEELESTKTPYTYLCLGAQKQSNTASLIQRSKKFSVKTVFAEDFFLHNSKEAIQHVHDIIEKSEKIYLSICLDVFSTAFAPGVSAPQPLGLFPWHAIPLIRHFAKSGKVIGLDIAELSPRFDLDHRTAKLAASLISEFIHHYKGIGHE